MAKRIKHIKLTETDSNCPDIFIILIVSLFKELPNFIKIVLRFLMTEDTKIAPILVEWSDITYNIVNRNKKGIDKSADPYQSLRVC